MGKRYYYDSKGRYRGKSSSTFIADGKTYKMLAIMAAVVIMWNMLFGNKGDIEQQPEQIEQTQQASTERKTSEPPSLSQSDIAPTNVPTEAGLPTDTPSMVRDATKEYMQREYVNGDPNCPRDLIEYHQAQCEAGETQSCSIAAC